MKPETRKQLVRWAAGAHLVIALIYSTHLSVEHFIPPALERLLRVYGSYSGAYAHFDFFAPSVVSQVRVQFRLGKGDEIIRTFEVVSPSSEVNQRLATMFNYYLRPTVRPLLVNSWARYALAKNPDAQWVQTRIEFLEIPTLTQLKEGKKAAWVEVGRFAAMREAAPVR